MTSNSRSATHPTIFGSASLTATKASDAYSDSLMDDLFGDVDRILEGDLSACMTVVQPSKKAAHTGTRTVQLPDNFTPKSATELYQVTMAAGKRQQTYVSPAVTATHQSTIQQSVGQQSSQQSSQQSIKHPSVGRSSRPQSAPQYRSSSYHKGGRPMTSSTLSAAQSGNFQSTVIQTPTQTSKTPAIGPTIDVHPTTEPLSSNSFYAQGSSSEFASGNVAARPPQTIFEPDSHKSRQAVSLPFLLVGAAGMSVASTLGLWALGNNAPGGIFAFNTEASAAEIPNTDAEFLVYLQKSLENISASHPPAGQSQALSTVIPAAAQALAVPTTVPNVNVAPATGVLPNLPGASAPTSGVIERVFVPVYENKQAPSNQPTNQTVASAPLPNVATPSSASRPTVPVPAPVAAAAAIPPGAPVEAAPSVPMVPVGENALPTPTEIAVAPTNSAVTGLTDTTPYAEQVLVGVLNLGSRSAALFDVDGTSQRAYVGDRIGTSDWTLVSVNGQDVVIRRDGEVRSVYIGQRF